MAIPAKIQSSRSSVSVRSRSILTGSMARLRPRRCDSRLTWVSTTTPLGMPKASPRTTLAVLRATPRRRRQFRHGAGDFAVEVVQQLGGGLANGAGLAAKEAGLADDLFNFELGGGGQGPGCGIALKEFGCDPVDGDVGGLGRRG